MANCDGISAFPDGDNLFSWVATITGPTGTVFADTTYRVSLKFPTDYPFVPPLVRFETPIFHPNVDQHGNICLDILKDKWSAVYSVQTVLLSIQSLLGGNGLWISICNHKIEPNNDSPLNIDAARLWTNQEGRKH